MKENTDSISVKWQYKTLVCAAATIVSLLIAGSTLISVLQPDAVMIILHHYFGDPADEKVITEADDVQNEAGCKDISSEDDIHFEDPDIEEITGNDTDIQDKAGYEDEVHFENLYNSFKYSDSKRIILSPAACPAEVHSVSETVVENTGIEAFVISKHEDSDHTEYIINIQALSDDSDDVKNVVRMMHVTFDDDTKAVSIPVSKELRENYSSFKISVAGAYFGPPVGAAENISKKDTYRALYLDVI